MQTTLENNRTKFYVKISSEFWQVAVFVRGRFWPHHVYMPTGSVSVRHYQT